MHKPPFHKSVVFAWKGLVWMLKNERNFQLEVTAFVINLILILFFNTSNLETAFILLICALVLVAEILNTGIEKLCDFIEPNYNINIGIIKDISAGGVLLATIFAVLIGGIIYWPYLQNMLSS